VVADHAYASRHALYRSALAGQPAREDEEPLITRQALHAYAVTFRHPATRRKMTVTAPLPADFERALAALRDYRPSEP
jgi:23S rRNA pseudouridine1911/1915/1917 synthase